MKSSKTNNVFFLFSFLFLCLILWSISFFIILPDYKKLQLEKNLKNIEVLISNMDTNIENIKNITNDYSKWDNSYEFVNNLNKDYIHENFREGTNTLEDLDIDFIIYTNKNGNILFSKLTNKSTIRDINTFQKSIQKKLDEFDTYNSIEIYNSKPLYLVKSQVMKSDESGSSNGYIYSGKFISNEMLIKSSKIFKNIEIVDYKIESNDYIGFSSPNIFEVKIVTNIDKEIIKNFISIYNKNKHVFSLFAPTKVDIISRGTSTIVLYNIILSALLLIVFLIVYINKKKLEEYSNQLENKVNERTLELNKTLRTVEKQNEELNELSNIDFLTNIRNRRSFFIESKKLLKKAISENKEFCIVIIDIDFFKKINDKYGHAMGDEVLKEFCNIVNSCISKKEVFGRFGGEEFCITFYDKKISEVEKIAMDIRKKCENVTLEIKEYKITFTVSLGLSSRNKLEQIDEILQVADDLLYQAKSEGRNRLIRSSKNI